jgi:hypothetical protein
VLKAMFVKKLTITAAAVFTIGVLGAGTGLLTWPTRAADAGQEKQPEAQGRLARRVTRQTPAVGDIASVLHIHKTYCEVDLGAAPRSGTFVVEFELYKKGRKTNSPLSGGGVGVAAHSPVPRQAKISVQAVDLDYLPLAGGAKGHCRVKVDLDVGSTVCGTSADVPKSVFDFSKVSGSSAFPATAGSPTEVPLFFLLANTNKIVGASTVKGVIESNSEADVLIAFLRLAR